MNVDDENRSGGKKKFYHKKEVGMGDIKRVNIRGVNVKEIACNFLGLQNGLTDLWEELWCLNVERLR